MWSDIESDRDYLNFSEVSQLAVDILSSSGMLPVSIGVFGNWGAGKSSLLKFIEHQLDSDRNDWLIIRFDAWLYQGFDDSRAALLEVITSELGIYAADNQRLAEKIKQLLSHVNGFRALSIAFEGAALLAGIPTSSLIARGINSISSLADGINDNQEYANLIQSPNQKSPPQQIKDFRDKYEEILCELKKPLVVIIDNLDRCLPTNAIHTLEAIRLFLFLPNTAFIIAADEEMIRSSVADYFKGASERHQIDYIDKLIQVPIRVPKAGIREIRSYLFMLYALDSEIDDTHLEVLRKGLEEDLRLSWRNDPMSRHEALQLVQESENDELAREYELADRIAPILAGSPIIYGNPRIVKRLLNVVKLRSQIAKRRAIPLDKAVITKLVIFERCAGSKATSDLYRLIDKGQGKPNILQKLEEAPDSDLPSEAPDSWSNNPSTKSFVLEWAKLPPLLGSIDLRAAIYLSRETMPIGAYVVGLSPKGRETLRVLANTSKMSSPTAIQQIKGLAIEEYVLVMEGIIDQLQHVTNWSKQPDGFSGACLLARKSTDTASLLTRFISSLDSGGQKIPWMNKLLKDEEWNKK